MNIDRDEVAKLTKEYGGDWAIAHSRRLLSIVDQIDEGLTYDKDAVWLAAHLHDWGAYQPWSKEGIDHAERSSQVADFFLCDYDIPDSLRSSVLEIIANHHSDGCEFCTETILLRDADALDFLGVVGTLRDFSKNHRDMKKAYQSVRSRRDKLPGLLYLDKAKELAKTRVERMDDLLSMFEEETYGYF